MDSQSMMHNQMMMKEMQKHHAWVCGVDVLMLVGLATIIFLLAKILKVHRR